MLTQETQKLISNLLEIVAENERSVEEVRQVLAEQDNFDPLALFNKLCNGNNGISKQELSYFLEDYSVRHLSREIDQLFFTYNRSRESMGYTSFLKMILPSSSHFLRQLKVELIPHRRKIIEVTNEIEWRLIRILEKELQLYRQVEQQKEQLSKRWDFKVSSAFRCISLRQTNAEIEHGDLLYFIESMNGNTSSDDILNILRRCDHDKDGKIGVLDLEISLTPFKRSKQVYFNQALQLQENKRESFSISQMKSSTKKRSYAMDQQKENAEISFYEEKQAKARSHSHHTKNHQRREDNNKQQEKIYLDHPISQPNKKYDNYFSVNVTPTKGDLGQDWEKPHNKSEVFNGISSYCNPTAGYKKQLEEESKIVSNMKNGFGKQRTNSFQLEYRNSEEIDLMNNRDSLLQQYNSQEHQQTCFTNYKQELKKQIHSQIKEKVQEINYQTQLRSEKHDFNNSSKIKKPEESFLGHDFKEEIRNQIKSELKEKHLDKINKSFKRDISLGLSNPLIKQRAEGYLGEHQRKEDIKNPIQNSMQQRYSVISKQNEYRDQSFELNNSLKVEKAEELITRQKQKEIISNQIQNEIKEKSLQSLNNSYKKDLSFESSNTLKVKKVEELLQEDQNKSEIKQQIERKINEKLQGSINPLQERGSASELNNPAEEQILEKPLPQLHEEQKLKIQNNKDGKDICSQKYQLNNYSYYSTKQISEQQLPIQQDKISQLLSTMISVFREIESLKESLSMRADFNLKDILKTFDWDSQNSLRVDSFTTFLSKAKVQLSIDQIQCFISRICPTRILKTEDIEGLFKPLTQEYRNLLENRISFFDPATFHFDSFSPETKHIVSSLLRESILGENQLEKLKRELSEQKGFSLEKLFEFFEDKRQHGFITHESLKKAIESLKMFIVDADIKNIMKRFNSNENGKVSFENYAHHILPIKNSPY